MMEKPVTKEALYTLMLMNDDSRDIPFLPLEAQEEETRKESLTRVLKQGYKDLQEVGLLKGSEPTEDFVNLGFYLSEYCKVTYHIQVDENFYCAPQVDEYNRMCVVITKVGANAYIVDYTTTFIFLSILIGEHDALKDIDDFEKNYLKSVWSVYSYMRFMVYYGDRSAIRIKSEQLGRIIKDNLFVKTEQSGLIEYNLMEQKIRSLAPDELKHHLIEQMKVEI